MNHSHTLALLSLGALLAACSGNTVKEKLGLNRNPPDEFRVVSQPPLSVPPQFNLIPPGSQPAPSFMPADKKAQALIIGTGANNAADQGNTFALKPADNAVAEPVNTKSSVTAKAGGSSAESEFLKDAGADKADPSVRKSLVEEKEAVQDQPEEKSWWDIFGSSSSQKDPMVDAQKEAQRIQQDKAQGQPVTTGDTPDVPQKDTGLLGRIFGY